MKSNAFTAMRFAVALLTIMALVAKPYIPPKTLTIYPAPFIDLAIYGPTDANDDEAVQWVDRERKEWLCNYKASYGASNCGLSLSWTRFASPAGSEVDHPLCESADSDDTGDGWGWENERSCIVGGQDAAAERTASEANPERGDPAGPIKSLDFSGYHGMNVSVHYEGRANFLRLYVRNLNPMLSDFTDSNSGKFMSAYLRTKDLKAGPVYVSLSEFNVEEWWAIQNDLPRSLTAPEFDRIVGMGIDHIEHGTHRMRVDLVELVGERIATETFLIIILLFWLVFLIIEFTIRYYQLYASSSGRAQKINQLNSQTQLLEQEKQLLKTRSLTDPLTGIFNRAGLDRSMQQLRSGVDLAANLGLLVIDIDHFKKANDTYGHEWGDQVLKTLAQLISSNIREDDIFARWGGEEFVLVTCHASKDSLLTVAEKLRAIVSSHVFEGADGLTVAISMGATTLKSWEFFEAAFKRADRALYQAKVKRNCVVYDI